MHRFDSIQTMEFFAKTDGLYLGSKRFKLKGVNWFGFETNIYTVHGLWSVSMDSLFAFLKQNKFNAIRVPIALELVQNLDKYRPSGIDFSKNPTLQNLTAGQLLDKFISKCREYSLLVLLDMHTHKSSGAIEPLWWVENFERSERDWINGWKVLVNRYKKQDHVFGCDIKNEPHGRATWLTGNKQTDWAKAAERIADAIHQINPKLLIFIEGIENPQGPNVGSFWGGNLSDVKRYKIKLRVPNKLVYSPHVYGPSVFMQRYFNDPNFPKNMPSIWNDQFGFIKDQKIGPIVVGEWGGKMEPGTLDEKWQKAFGAWLNSKDIDSFIWSLNENSSDTKGLVKEDWKTPVQYKLDLLARTYPNPTSLSLK